MKRKASVQWLGNLKAGNGMVSTDSGVLKDPPYSFAKRFGEEKGTNPEELAATAHASCFTMALSAELSNANLVPERLRTTCTITLAKAGGGSWGMRS